MKICTIIIVMTGTVFFSISAYAGNVLVINEIMQNPDAVTDSVGEWFEIYNPELTATDLNGWTIKDDGSNTHIISSSIIVPPLGYVVLGQESDSGLNGGLTVDYVYTGVSLGNGADEVILINPTESEIDRVMYDGGTTFPDPTGASMMLACDKSNTVDNNLGGNWFTSTTVFGDGDHGTPGADNCSSKQVGDMNANGQIGLEEAIIALQIVAGMTPAVSLGTYIPSTGDADAEDVLSGKKFSNDSATDIEGTMPDNGEVAITPTTSNTIIAEGYHNGSGKCEGDANLQPDKIKDNQTLFGITGTVYQFWGCRGGTWDVGICALDCFEATGLQATECLHLCNTRSAIGIPEESALCWTANSIGLTRQ